MKRMKRSIFAFIMVVALVMSSMTVFAAEESDTNTITINTVNDLKQISENVKNGTTYAGKTVVLATDLDLQNEEWTPIGDKTNSFQGTFDGNGKTISNLVITGSNSNVGLFGHTSNGEIKDLTIKNANVSGRLNVAVVAGTPYTSKYTNIKVTGHVEVNGMAYVGAVGGKNVYADWTDITVDVDDTSYVNAVSTENGIAYRTYVGGVIGFMGEGSHAVKNVTSNIDVIGDVCDVGGIVGIAHYQNNFENIVCRGDVTNNNTDAEGAAETGGIAGVWHNQKGTTVTINDCTFYGTVTAAGEDVTLTKGIVGAPYIKDVTDEESGTLKVTCNHCNVVTDKAVAATCTKTGLTEGSHCGTCGKVFVAQEVVKATGHTEVVDAAVAATCTKTGLTEGTHCSVCKEVLVAQEVVKATGHTDAVDKAVAATCTKTGLTEGKHCSVCKEVLVAQDVVKATSHTTEVQNAKAATCIETGYTGDSVCKVCEVVVEKGKAVAATGHTYVDGACACGDKIEVKVETEVVDTVTKEEVKVEEVKEVTIVEDANTVKAEISVKAETTVVATEVASAEDVTKTDAVKEGVISEETAEAVKETVLAGDTVKTEIVVNEVKTEAISTSTQANIEKAAATVGQNAEVVQYLDVSVVLKAASTGKELGTVNKLETPIKITVAIPENLKADNVKYVVIRDHDGVITKLPTVKNADGTLTFETDMFSTYALAVADATASAPKTGDVPMAAPIAGICIAGLVLVAAMTKKRSLAR